MSNSQSIERQLIGNAGDYISPNARLSWSLGEPVTETFLLNHNHLTQGFQQGVFTNLPLPVSLIQFDGRRLDHTLVELHWEVAQEIQLDNYELERRQQSASKFQKVAVQSALNASHYSQFDENSFTENSFYRLRMNNLNGGFSYSNIIQIAGIQPALLMHLSPNPTQDILTINIFPDSNQVLETLNVQIYDLVGQLKFQKEILFNRSAIQIPDFRHFPVGNYSVLIRSNLGTSNTFLVTKL